MNKVFLTGLAIVASVTFSSATMAQSAGLSLDLANRSGSGAASSSGPVIGGSFTSNVDVGNVTAESDDGSTASNRIGSMTGGAVGGNFDSTVRAGDVKATATKDSCSENIIGSVGPAACGN